MIEPVPATVPSLHRDDPVDLLPAPGLSHADVSELLLMEFGPTHGLRLVSAVLRRCRVELAAESPTGSPAALERLARAKLAVGPVPLSAVLTR